MMKAGSRYAKLRLLLGVQFLAWLLQRSRGFAVFQQSCILDGERRSVKPSTQTIEEALAISVARPNLAIHTLEKGAGWIWSAEGERDRQPVRSGEFGVCGLCQPTGGRPKTLRPRGPQGRLPNAHTVQAQIKSNSTHPEPNDEYPFHAMPADILLKILNLSPSGNVCRTMFAPPNALARVPPFTHPPLLPFPDSPSAGSTLPFGDACSAPYLPSAPYELRWVPGKQGWLLRDSEISLPVWMDRSLRIGGALPCERRSAFAMLVRV